jgi:hypothetical protein
MSLNGFAEEVLAVKAFNPSIKVGFVPQTFAVIVFAGARVRGVAVNTHPSFKGQLIVRLAVNAFGVVVFFTIVAFVFSGVHIALVADEFGETLSVGGNKGLFGLGVEEKGESSLSILTLFQLSFGFFTGTAFFVGFSLITTGFAGLLDWGDTVFFGNIAGDGDFLSHKGGDNNGGHS